jgi:putative transposase
MTLPNGPNQRWSLDFVSDVLANGRRFRLLVAIDDFTRECLALIADTLISARRNADFGHQALSTPEITTVLPACVR